ncbi:MAG: protein jag [Ruminococcus sp.]|nr:protein jag [Ruminococcus sp.]
MRKEFTANTVEEAKAKAAEFFKADLEKIEFTVIEEEKKGILGIGRKDAVVAAEYDPSKAETAAEYIKRILESMDIDAELTVTESEDGALIDISGETSGAVIGRRGETLDSLQYLAGMAANRSDKEYYRITLDCCGYRERRKEALEELARKISRFVLRTGCTKTLEPMNPYERRIIHAAVGEIEGVTSKSIGEEPYRKVVISSVSGRPERKGGYDKRGRRSDRRGGIGERKIERRSSMDLMKTSFEKDYKKPKPEDSITDGGLYDKIDF